VKDAMEGAVMEPGGTGSRARVPDVRVGGKTGTAQNPHGRDHALFVAFAPVEAPEIVVACVVEESGHGGSVAAPVVGEVLRAYFQSDSTAVAVTAPAEGD
jgi:penicillin-binding protein 2